MNLFSIKDIENLSGIKAHTWRIWEQRYGLELAQRRDSNHRYYNSENLKHLLRISYLYHQGIKISRIATLNDQQKIQLTLNSLSEDDKYGFFIAQLVESSLELNDEKFHRTLNEALKMYELEDVYVKIVVPYQQKIGLLWLTNHVLPAQEHFTSNIIMKVLATAIDKLPLVENRNKDASLVLFTPENELHEIPLYFVYYLLKKQGKKVAYFGSNVSMSILESYTAVKDCTQLFFFLTTNLTSITPGEYLMMLSDRFPDKAIVMSGPQVQYVEHVPKNVRLLTSHQEMIQFGKE